ncbi:MAG: GTP-binding Obg [Trebouxia sp. A1-2]|nr:MAG: GTP-binding Obg [Trebouxia sp. A1-2]
MQSAKSFSPKLLRQCLQNGVPKGRTFQLECHQNPLAAFSADVRCFQSLQRSFFTAACRQTPVSVTERTGKSFYVDRIRVEVLAGNGGSGCVAFWKSAAKGKFQPPDGGNGGHGGNVVVQASAAVKSMGGLRQLHRAQNGGPGGNQKKVGRHGADKVIQVPLGTVIHKVAAAKPEDHHSKEGVPFTFQQHWIGARDYVSSEEESEDASSADEKDSEPHLDLQLLADLVQHEESVVVAQGGQGGRGNAHMRRLGQNRPAVSEREVGQAGERAVLILEMKSLADIGLVGLPNVGKSTLLCALSRAKPEVADYAFTTLRPQLGVVHYPDTSSLAVADIPGLIRGASQNKGLGHRFLRHVERSNALAFVLDLSGGVGPDKGPTALQQLHMLQEELELYRAGLTDKPALLIANKADKVSEAATAAKHLEEMTGLPTVLVSGQTRKGIEQLKLLMRQVSPTDVSM